jgi:hypothetical protein
VTVLEPNNLPCDGCVVDRLCGQGSWLQIQTSRVPFPALPDFLRSSGSGKSPLSLVSTNEELLERKSSGFDLEIREYGRGGSVTLTKWHRLSAKVGNNFANKRRSSVGTVRSQIQATGFSLVPPLSIYALTAQEQGPLDFMNRGHGSSGHTIRTG